MRWSATLRGMVHIRGDVLMLLATGWVAHALPHVGQPGWGPAQAEMQTCQMPAQANGSDPMFHKYVRRLAYTHSSRISNRKIGVPATFSF